MKANPYFSKKEFECKCGCGTMPQNQPNDELIDILCEIREHFGRPLIIKSGYRCPSHNAAVGGAKSSRHIVGDAADFTIKDVKTIDVYDYVVSKYENYGIARKILKNYPFRGFVHFDTRGKKARWLYSGSL